MTEGIWPPEYLAVLQDGDGEASYFRAVEPGESPEAFAGRIGKLVARDIEYSGTVFIDVIAGNTGESNPVLVEQTLAAIENHKARRREARQHLTTS